MNKKRIKILGSAVLITSLVFSTSYAAMAAPAKSTKDVTTGRTVQNRQTGVLTYNSVDIPRYAKTVTLSGTVVIDGPKLVLMVNDNDVSSVSNLQKVADKTWTYSYTADLTGQVGDVTFNIKAHTIYANGMPATDIHTSATPVVQTVHVPFVRELKYINFNWDDYKRELNTFTLSYNLVKIWDDGSREIVEPKVSASIPGTENYAITASDITHEKGKVETLGTVTPPVKVMDFSVSSDSFTGYDQTSNTYLLNFVLHSDLSNGLSSDKPITERVKAGTTSVYTATDSTSPGAPYSEEFTFTAPKAPAAPVLTVTSAVPTITNQAELANNQDKNNYRVEYDLTITLSDGSTHVFEKNVITIPYNSGNNIGSKDVTEDRIIEGTTYTVTYTVTVNLTSK
jgi:hypothetical protein